MKKRKEFLSGKQRLLGEEHKNVLDMAQNKHAFYEKKSLNKKWKQASAQFRVAVGNSKNGTSEEAAVVDDRVECQFCKRKFAQVAADRHIPICENKHKGQMKVKRGK